MGLAQYKCFWDRADPGIGEQAGLRNKKTVSCLQAAGISTASDHPLKRLCSLARQVQTEQFVPIKPGVYFFPCPLPCDPI